MSVLLSAITFNPAMASSFANGPAEGVITAQAISPDSTCKPGAICAKNSMAKPRNGCFFNNFYNGSVGGTPLTVNVTQSGGNGSPVYVYWVNATNLTITIKGYASAKYYCV